MESRFFDTEIFLFLISCTAEFTGMNWALFLISSFLCFLSEILSIEINKKGATPVRAPHL
jgi:hypothetical protein